MSARFFPSFGATRGSQASVAFDIREVHEDRIGYGVNPKMVLRLEAIRNWRGKGVLLYIGQALISLRYAKGMSGLVSPIN